MAIHSFPHLLATALLCGCLSLHVEHRYGIISIRLIQYEHALSVCRYAPAMRQAGDWWRWLSSLLLQDSFPHLLATALLYGGLSLHVEHRYGTRRTLLLTVLAALAGNFLDTLIMVRQQRLPVH